MSNPPLVLKTGERARVTFAGRTVEALVIVASPNGRSLFLAFDAMLGGYVGQMPVLWEDGAFYDLVCHRVVTIEEPQP